MASKLEKQKGKAVDLSTEWSEWEWDRSGYYFASRSGPNGEVEYDYHYLEDDTALTAGHFQNGPHFPGPDVYVDVENGDGEREPTVQAGKLTSQYKTIDPWFSGTDNATENANYEDTLAVRVATKLNPRYKEIAAKEQKNFWKIGRVFAVLSTEPARGGDSTTGDKFSMPSKVHTIYGDKAFTEVRRFVIVQKGYGNSLCCPIHTYQGQAILMPTLPGPTQHAIIYTSNHPPDEYLYTAIDGTVVTENLTKDPIKVHRDEQGPEGDLGTASRIDYSNIYTIEHYVKVLNIGMVENGSLSALCRNSFLRRDHKPKRPGKPPPGRLTSRSKTEAIETSKLDDDYTSSARGDIEDDIFSSHQGVSESPPTSFVAADEVLLEENPNTTTTKRVSDSLYNRNEESDDIRSVITDEGDIGSLAASRPSQLVRIAEDHIAVVFAKRNDLQPLFSEALTKVSRERFVKNCTKLLKAYYTELREHTQGNLEDAAASLLRSRWARIRISRKISEITMPESDIGKEEHIRRAEGMSLPDLEGWLKNNPGLAPDNEPSAIADGDDGSVSSEDVDFNEETDLPLISEIERLLTSGPYFTSLTINLRIFLLPASLSSLTRILMTIPRDRIRFSEEREVSIKDQIQVSIEHYTTKDWDWWPLSQPVRALQKGHTIIRWKCHCGTYQWTTVTDAEAESYRSLLHLRGDRVKYNHLCAQKSRPKIKVSTISTFRGLQWFWKQKTPQNFPQQSEESQTSSKCKTPRTTSATPQSPHIQQLSGNAENSTASLSHIQQPQQGQWASNIGGVSPDRPNNPANPILGPSSRSSPGGHTGIDVPPPSSSGYVLFGVKGTRRTLELPQLHVKDYHKDPGFFLELCDQYRASQRNWRHYFSVWKFGYCDFVKKMFSNSIIAVGKELPEREPECLEYVYYPKPAVENPPITPHEFSIALNACRPNCRYSWFPFHECYSIPNRTYALDLIPKRKTPLGIKVDVREVAWGLEAKDSLCLVTVFIYHLLMVPGPFVFWAVWVRYYPDDISGAGTPMSVMIALLALFWGSSAVLKSLRNPWE